MADNFNEYLVSTACRWSLVFETSAVPKKWGTAWHLTTERHFVSTFPELTVGAVGSDGPPERQPGRRLMYSNFEDREVN